MENSVDFKVDGKRIKWDCVCGDRDLSTVIPMVGYAMIVRCVQCKREYKVDNDDNKIIVVCSNVELISQKDRQNRQLLLEKNNSKDSLRNKGDRMITNKKTKINSEELDDNLVDEFSQLVMKTGKDIGKEIIFPVIKTEFDKLKEQVHVLLEQIKCGEFGELQKPITARLENILENLNLSQTKIDQLSELLNDWSTKNEASHKKMSLNIESRFDLLTSMVTEKTADVSSKILASDRKLHMMFGLIAIVLVYIWTFKHDLWIGIFTGLLILAWVLTLYWKGISGLMNHVTKLR